MSGPSSIEWTDATWNPLRGCTRVSPGCGGPGPHGGCYAEVIAARFSDPGQAYHGLAVRTSKGGRWTGRVALAEHLLDAPLRWRKPRRIFVNSMSDLFHESVPDEWIDRIFAVMALAPRHTFQVPTKRPERMRAWFDRFNNADWLGNLLDLMDELGSVTGMKRGSSAFLAWPLPNVWLGVSVEDQERADERIPDLLATPAAVRFLSCEPLLGPVDLTFLDLSLVEARYQEPSGLVSLSALDGVHFDAEGSVEGIYGSPDPKIDWVIVGGESGPRARPMHPDWARSLRDQCAEAGTAFFFKQWGEWASGECGARPDRGYRTATWFDEAWTFDRCGVSRDDDHCDDEPDVYRVGKAKAGRLLDGVEHNAFPAPSPSPALSGVEGETL